MMAKRITVIIIIIIRRRRRRKFTRNATHSLQKIVVSISLCLSHKYVIHFINLLTYVNTGITY